MVLKHLSHGPHSGYQLIKEIQEQTGWKPSYGSIYPLLEQLRKEGMATTRQEGKKKLYTLTASGNEEINQFTAHHKEMVEHFQEIQNVMLYLCGTEQDPLFERITAMLKRGKLPFKEILKTGHALRSELARISKEGLMEERKDEVIQILECATDCLKKITRKEKVKRKRQAAKIRK